MRYLRLTWLFTSVLVISSLTVFSSQPIYSASITLGNNTNSLQSSNTLVQESSQNDRTSVSDNNFFERLKQLPSSFTFIGVTTSVTVVVSVISLIISINANIRSTQTENIKDLLGEKEQIAFAVLKLIKKEKLPRNSEYRKLIIDAIIQGCIFEGSDRARVLLYQAIEKFYKNKKYRIEFEESFLFFFDSFKGMNDKFDDTDLDLSKAYKRIKTIKKIITDVTST